MSGCIPDYEAISFRKMPDEYVIKEQAGDKERVRYGLEYTGAGK